MVIISEYYLERLKKIKVQKDLIERSLLKEGSYPDKQYVKQLVDNIGTRLAILDYINVEAGETVNIDKINNDMYAVYQDLKILYSIVAELANDKYIKLEAYINGYLNTIEELADRADKHAVQSIESTALNAQTVYYTNQLPSARYRNSDVIISLGSIMCSPQSKIIGYVEGDGFDNDKAVFSIGSHNITPYPVNNSYFKSGGTVQRNTYTYAVTDNDLIAGASRFKIPIESLSAQEHYHYDIYGGRDMIYKKNDTGIAVTDYRQEFNKETESVTSYSFYLTDATKINFEFSNTPIKTSFTEYANTSLKRNDITKFEFTIDKDTAFSFSTDGSTFATKETSAINNNSLYVANNTKARDFTIYEYQPGKKVNYDNVTLRIYNVNQSEFHIDMIAIKEINDLNINQRV